MAGVLTSLTILTELLEAMANESIQKTFEQLLYETCWKMRMERQTEEMIPWVCVPSPSAHWKLPEKMEDSQEQLSWGPFSKCHYILIGPNYFSH